ncbi:thiamine pyrophosphate-dependent dehydrogenase E1 component subunit alpha [Haloferula sp.]|uniref:thiamine pyrophosphate-dependent dehydrogenase E1 component subunit alpha n=1 Tax=Haloferula sp. TaxID=2497595 RepID=UPI003C709C95
MSASVYGKDEFNCGLSGAEKIAIFIQMVRIRRFEQRMILDFSRGEMGGFLVSSMGQESIAAGVRSVMIPADHGVSGWRGMGHALAAGMSMESMAAELMGRSGGCSKGKGGMFSFFDSSKHHWGCHATAAGQVPLAAGFAFALKMREIRGAAVCFLGEGAVNQGVYHESLNLAALFDLPVVFVIENNGYSMGTSQQRSSAFKDCLAKRAEGYDIEWDRFPDSDVYEIRTRAGRALQRARNESKPTVLEIETYRYHGATIADASSKKYRTPEEIMLWRNTRDTLTLWEERLVHEGVLDERQAKGIHEQAKHEALAAAKFAIDSPPPMIADIGTDVYAEVDEKGLDQLLGRYFF